jgi:hypothetical protein
MLVRDKCDSKRQNCFYLSSSESQKKENKMNVVTFLLKEINLRKESQFMRS